MARPEDVKDISMEVLNTVMTWAKAQPLWQQVVIADLIRLTDIDDARMTDYVRMVKLEAEDIDKLKQEVGEPLEGLDFEVADEGLEVRITELEATQNINLIADGSKLAFNRDGLNLVYGSNAAGKSGYTRILKNTCSCRHAEEIKGSTDRPHSEECKATVSYEVDGSHEAYEWTKSSSVSPALQTVHVFDEKSSSRFLVRENDIRFMPSGMDVLMNLSGVIEAVSLRLREESSVLANKLTSFELIFADYSGTRVYSLVTNLAAENALELHNKLKVLSKAENARRVELEKQIPIKESQSPSAQRRAEETLLSRLKDVQAWSRSLQDSIQEDNIKKISQLVKNDGTARAAAEKAKELKFDSDAYLSGTGDEQWRLLWEVAKSYSVEAAYPEHEYPHVQGGARCVLCQQLLTPEATERLKSFDTFVSDKSQELAVQSKRLLDRAIEDFSLDAPSAEYIQNITKTISVDEYAGIGDVQGALQGLSEIHESYRLKMASREEIDSFEKLDKWLTPLQELDATVAAIELKHKVPLDDKKYEEQLELERAELRGLTARMMLESHSESVLADIASHVAIANISKASKLASTSASSSQIGILSQEHVVSQLAKQFNDELKGLFSNKVRAELRKTRTSKGVPYCEIVLTGESVETKGSGVQSVLSEGEQKVVALAGFFAELSQNPSNSAIVFDDPVTSLDHTNLRKIARRIVKEAKKRQVIVFTHSIVFASELEDAVDKLGGDVAFASKSVMKLQSSGVVSDTIDFDNMKVRQRIDALEKMVGPIREKYTKGDVAVKDDVVSFYRNLRIAWERSIEEILFNQTVVRYRRDVKPSRLKNITIKDSDGEAVTANMEKCAQYVHDLSDEAGSAEVPEPDTLKADLEELKIFIQAVKARRE